MSENLDSRWMAPSAVNRGARGAPVSRAMHNRPALLVFLAATLIVVGCAAPGPGAGGSAGQAAAPVAKKRIVAAIQIDVPSMSARLTSPLPGGPELESMANASLARLDIYDVLQPSMAETVPTVENGLWKVLPDGRMEMTWRIRQGAQWHDGTPFTTADLLFTSKVGQDREIAFVGATAAYRFLESIDEVDNRTVILRWKSPYIEADRSIISTTTPLPKHLLENSYITNKEAFANQPYWTTTFIGTGPFRVREWATSSHVLLDANANYVLGPPKIDEIEVRFIPDPSTMAANILAGGIDLPVGNRTLSYEQTQDVLARWPQGTMDPLIGKSWFVGFPQFLNTDPPIVTNVQFRRALMHAVNRHALAEAFQGGLGPVAYSILEPTPQWAEIDARQPRYEYDPSRAARLLQDLGYTRGPDGMLRDARNQPLGEMKVMTTGQNDLGVKTAFAVADDWKQAGINAVVVVSSPQQERDLVYRATYPAMEIVQRGTGLANFDAFHTENAALPSNNYVGQRGRYMNPVNDALIDKYRITIDDRERHKVIGQVIDLMQDQLMALGFYYQVAPSIRAKRVLNQRPLEYWNGHVWDVSN